MSDNQIYCHKSDKMPFEFCPIWLYDITGIVYKCNNLIRYLNLSPFNFGQAFVWGEESLSCNFWPTATAKVDIVRHLSLLYNAMSFLFYSTLTSQMFQLFSLIGARDRNRRQSTWTITHVSLEFSGLTLPPSPRGQLGKIPTKVITRLRSFCMIVTIAIHVIVFGQFNHGDCGLANTCFCDLNFCQRLHDIWSVIGQVVIGSMSYCATAKPLASPSGPSPSLHVPITSLRIP